MQARIAAAITFHLLLAAAPRAAGGQQPSGTPSGTPSENEEPARFHADIVVTPERGDAEPTQVPAATAVLDAQTLQTRPAVSFGEALSFIPGFQVERGAVHAGRPLVSARGFFGGGEADYVLLLIDGVPIADTESGLADWSVVSLSSIRRIEASRGPGASMYGDAAVGGVIQVLTDRSARGAQIATTAGAFGTLTFDGVVRRQFARAAAEFSGILRRTSGVSNHSGAHYVGGTAGLDGRFGPTVWRWNGSGNGRANDDPGALTLDAARRDPRASDPLSRFDELQRHGFATAFALQRAAGSWGYQARIHANTRDEDVTRTILLAPALGDRQARTLSTRGIGGAVEGERRLGNAVQAGVVRFGIDVSRERLETSYRPVSDEGVPGVTGPEVSGGRARAGVFVSSAWNLIPRVRVSGAMRWDHVGDDAFGAPDGSSHQAWSPRLGVTVGLSQTPAVWLFSQVSNAFKVPTLNQLFDPRPYPDFQGGAFTISNRRLTPQRATNVEVGLQGGGASLHWSALAYRMHVDDEIDFDVRTFSYANLRESRHIGAELELGGRIWNRLQPSVSYALTRVEGDDRERQLKNVPRHSLTLAASVDVSSKLAATLRYRRTSGAFLDDANSLGIHGPSTFDLRVRRAFGRHLVFVDGVNLTNDRYEEYGFTLDDFRGGLVPYAYPGAPRALRVGLTLGF
ncbi:MAG: TonB-dependent receptor [Luteitalea sp.]|nr:TonB-dependent receptor [Luteitalea sp.]